MSFHPIYLFYGEDEYQLEEQLNRLIEEMVDPAWKEMDHITLDMTKVTIQDAIGEAETLPFGSERKVIVAKNAYFLTGSTLRGGVEHRSEVLQDYMANPTPTTVLILVAPYAKLDERKKVVKDLLKKANVFHAKPFTDQEREKWLRDELRRRNIKLAEEDFQYLSYQLPKIPMQAHHELEKLSLYASGKTELKRGELESILSHTVEGDVFALIDKALHQDVEGTFSLYRELRRQNEEPVKLLSLFGRQIRIMIEVKSLAKEGIPQKEIAARLKMHPYPIQLALELGREIPMENLIFTLSLIAETDFMMKQGLVDKGLGLEMILLRLQELRKKTTT